MDQALGSSRTIRVLLADDHPLMLAALRGMLQDQDGIEVVGQAQSAPELLALADRRGPDVVLTDLRMPGGDGAEMIAELVRRTPTLKVVVLSASDDADSVSGALAAGARAFVVKTTAPTDVAAVVRQVHGGMVFHAPPAPAAPPGAGRAPAGPELTERERTILGAIAAGKTTAVISRELWVSDHTVKFHLTNIYRKLGVQNRAGAIRYALETGLTED